MIAAPAGFSDLLEQLPALTQGVEGFLTQREMRFLALLAACPTTSGVILEVGSFKGKSTIILAKAAHLSGEHTVVAVDPLIPFESTGRSLPTTQSFAEEFFTNIRRAGIERHVEFHQTSAGALAQTWTRPIRLLWIDGDHTYAGAKADYDDFAPFLSDDAIVALHDVLNRFEGPVRVFAEQVLLSRHYGATGLCGSIAWAQYRTDPQASRDYEPHKLRLYRRLSRLVPYVAFDRPLNTLAKRWYKLLRSRVPHPAIEPIEWLRQVRFRPGHSIVEPRFW